MNTKIIALIAIAALGLLLVTAAYDNNECICRGHHHGHHHGHHSSSSNSQSSAQSNACNGGSKCSNISSQQQGSGNRAAIVSNQ